MQWFDLLSFIFAKEGPEIQIFDTLKLLSLVKRL